MGSVIRTKSEFSGSRPIVCGGSRFELDKGLIMADITSISATGATTQFSFDRATRVTPAAPPSDGGDHVEISELARLLSSLDPDSQALFRAEKVANIRDAIASGTYETEDKLDYVVSRLMDVLQDGPHEMFTD
jgi:anti-sigma28 factor (negative regulator of flagellin synthesis)